MKKIRPCKENYYLNIAEAVSKRGTCLRRNYGAVIVKNDEIIATGYNGAPRGKDNCIDLGICYRENENIKSGTQYEKCRSVHAEMNAIISAARKDMLNSTLYLVGIESKNDSKYVPNTKPCLICQRLIINAGIKKVVVRLNENKFKEIKVENIKIPISNNKNQKIF
ncbi:MAG TPA: deaminase [Patescibacteria group bacterium]|nr:deaminase [Patescibacteria group bacterium]